MLLSAHFRLKESWRQIFLFSISRGILARFKSAEHQMDLILQVSFFGLI
jgi:hypothetical protein